VHYAKDFPDISILAEQAPYVKIRIGGQKIKTRVCKGARHTAALRRPPQPTRVY
jgi:hypothetical protein